MEMLTYEPHNTVSFHLHPTITNCFQVTSEGKEVYAIRLLAVTLMTIDD